MLIPTKGRRSSLKRRVCAFEGCNRTFLSSGPMAKYCSEHINNDFIVKRYQRKTKEKHDIEFNKNNKRINHNYFYATKEIHKCECCGIEYEILVLPRQFNYPKHCEEHRNEYKRNRYIQKYGVLNAIN